MKKTTQSVLTICIILLVGFIVLNLGNINAKNSQKTVGIIIPLQHKALDDITTGLTDTIKKQYGPSVKIKISNAQNDTNLLRSITQQMIAQQVDLLVPIGASATLMSIKLTQKIPIFSVATYSHVYNDLFEKGRPISGINDEIIPKNRINFLKKIIPNINHLTIVYSANEKVVPEVKEIEQVCQKDHLSLKKIMVHNMSELYNLSQAIPEETQAVLILKDHLIVNGIQTLSKITHQKNIPLITSDEGSIINGGDFAFGIKEKDIGVQAGHVLVKLLNGEKMNHFPPQTVKKMNVFYNEKMIKIFPKIIKQLKKVSENMNYNLIQSSENI